MATKTTALRRHSCKTDTYFALAELKWFSSEDDATFARVEMKSSLFIFNEQPLDVKVLDVTLTLRDKVFRLTFGVFIMSVSESSGDSHLLHQPPYSFPRVLVIHSPFYPVPSSKASNALVAPVVLQMSMGGS
ncbi:hypothetical protein EVAR_29882_1 [Eumeta japonica]|uniref:Uncharacterized protein n=1 Tax=Eumeta variegata TaxID=151549 RepID=A0A4C1V843_EUMVA|nr:hypothetical protein EVAR_29882_1 [Eumeta japonica]